MSARELHFPEAIRAEVLDKPKARPRELADSLGISEGALVAAHVGHGATPLQAAPNDLIPAVCGLGEVMALTRNESAVHEKIGVYDNFHAGDHASMVLTENIDLRMFPKHWVHAFAVEKQVDGATRRSIQVFDAAGDAVHKVILRDGSDVDAWHKLLRELEGPEAAPAFAEREPVEGPKGDAAKADILRQEWAKMTDTHQFLRLTSKLKMNRLGAYRIAGAPFAEALEPSALDTALRAIAEDEAPIMLFVGNRGCIQIHSGPIFELMPMGPWQNVMDPGFNLHLRADHVAEVWLVEKPTKRGPALSIEAFDAQGMLILQCFGQRKEGIEDNTARFRAIAETLPSLAAEEVLA
ncbi:hemin-degrading factor [Gymnodinialimonas ceratoperidinii]|uniref:Hemin-degrading factor n=1 Tax=Gymnodinialimonas ceratoperidinii TaxID=2856823 RepID=A0A8F6TW20_9RHOB|nr:ChuX/HutX family heme-like substrate-binding protein [Gymnodinialimonas ceratoperidinii]QXT38954.1 hemin-degrading factor [Gymnodinialimonas ceratoperidinii]